MKTFSDYLVMLEKEKASKKEDQVKYIENCIFEVIREKGKISFYKVKISAGNIKYKDLIEIIKEMNRHWSEDQSNRYTICCDNADLNGKPYEEDTNEKYDLHWILTIQQSNV